MKLTKNAEVITPRWVITSIHTAQVSPPIIDNDNLRGQTQLWQLELYGGVATLTVSTDSHEDAEEIVIRKELVKYMPYRFLKLVVRGNVLMTPPEMRALCESEAAA